MERAAGASLKALPLFNISTEEHASQNFIGTKLTESEGETSK
jgi:hypothetical protein